jgi:trigger factor
VEINPEISDIDFKDLELKKTVYKIDQKEIDIQLKLIQKNMAQLKTIETERPVQKADYVMIDYEGLKDGNPFPATEKTENFTMKIGDATISEELDLQITGMKPDENKEIPVTFPDDSANKALAGQKIDFQVQLHEIREEILPEINDEFAKDVGEYENLDDLEKKITENLEQGYAKRTEQELNEQIFQALIKKTTFEVPEALVKAELDGIISDAERSFSYQNKTMEDLGLTREGMAEQYRETAVKQVRRFLILDRIIDQEKLTPSDDEIDDGFEKMSETINQPLDQIKQFYEQNKDRLEVFKQSLLEKKVMDLIIESSRITEVPPEKEAETTTDEK